MVKFTAAYMTASSVPVIWLWTERDYGPLFGIIALALLTVGGFKLWKAIAQYNHNNILKEYAAIVKPIFVYQLSPTDQTVFLRAETHRRLLKESGNKLYADELIEVIEHYYQDPNFDYCENFEEYWNTRADFERDYLRNWAKRTWGNDDIARKKYLHNQLIPDAA